MKNLLGKLQADKVFYEKKLKIAILENEHLDIINEIKSILSEIDDKILGEKMTEELKSISENPNLTR